jgi:integrase
MLQQPESGRLKCVTVFESHHLIPIVATAYWTGMRKGEILGLTWDKVFLKDREIRLEIEDTKDDEKRVIPIPEALYKILSIIPRPFHNNHVFLYKNTPLVAINEGFKTAMKNAKIPCGRNVKGGLTFHDLSYPNLNKIQTFFKDA